MALMKKWITIALCAYLAYLGMDFLNRKADEELFQDYHDSKFADHEEELIHEDSIFTKIEDALSEWFDSEEPSEEDEYVDM